MDGCGKKWYRENLDDQDEVFIIEDENSVQKLDSQGWRQKCRCWAENAH
jgi:hypothetical protein